MTEDDRGSKTPRMGFAGLSSLVSDIGEALEGQPESHEAEPAPDQKEREPRASSPPRATPDRQGTPRQPSRQGGGGRGVVKVVLALAGILYLGLVVAEIEKDGARPASNSGRPTAPTDRGVTPDLEVTTPPTAQSRPANRFTETKPPLGQGRVLTVAQIRYCLAESIRIDAADPEVDTYRSIEVDYFNELVDDYNRRCADFRYFDGTLTRARSEVEPFRSELMAEGRSHFLRQVGRSSTTPSATPDPMVREAQQGLNRLGYDAGPADGLMGPQTRNAIIAFQKAQGLSADGRVDRLLLLALSSTNPNR